MKEHHIGIGGLTALGFDSAEKYLLVITHNGRGVFETTGWTRVARDPKAFDWKDSDSESNLAPGFGPLEGQMIKIHYFDFDEGRTEFWSQSKRYEVECESSFIDIYEHDLTKQTSLWKRVWDYFFGEQT